MDYSLHKQNVNLFMHEFALKTAKIVKKNHLTACHKNMYKLKKKVCQQSDIQKIRFREI